MSRKSIRREQRKQQRRKIIGQSLVIGGVLAGLTGVGLSSYLSEDPPEASAFANLSDGEDVERLSEMRGNTNMTSRGLDGERENPDVVRAPVEVWLEIPGAEGKEVVTTAETVRELLLEHGVVLGENDIVNVELDEEIIDGMQVQVLTAEVSTVIEAEEIPFDQEEQEDSSLLEGTEKVLQEGKPGEKKVTYRLIIADGKEVEKQVLSQVTIAQPVNEITAVGTKAQPASGGSGGGGSASAPPSGPVDPGSARAIARDLVATRGWDDGEFSCLDALWERESNWRHTATNPSSGAYGIPQAYPGSKMASEGADWRTNPETQIRWGLNYIAGRYGTPCSAWAHSERVNWY